MPGGTSTIGRNVVVVAGLAAGVGVLGYWYYQRQKRYQKEKEAEGELSMGSGAEKRTAYQSSLESKKEGNDLFKEGRYAEAIQRYSDAIEACLAARPGEIPKSDIAAFYQNRAAAYDKLDRPEKVVLDCTEALKYQKQYSKAILRRAKAFQKLGKNRESLNDYTAGCVLDGFQNRGNLDAADEVLRNLGKELAAEKFSNRDNEAPLSTTFVESYLSSFCEDPIMTNLPKQEPQGEDLHGYSKAQKCLLVHEFDDVIPACAEELTDADSAFRCEALLLRATFYLVLGRSAKALRDFESLFKELELSPENKSKAFKTNAFIKRGSLHMQQNRREESLADFELAEQTDPENADVYHHRGQLLVLLDDINRAQKDFERSVQLRPDFSVSAVQRGYCRYRAAMASHSMLDIEKSMKEFVKTVEEEFPECAEGFALLGQAYMEQQQYIEADAAFAKAQKLAPNNANVYVHRGLLELQWHADPLSAIGMIKQATKIDPNCEFAFETLGTIEMQRGNVDASVKYFDQALELARTEFEMGHLFTLREAVLAQKNVAQEFGVTVPTMVS